LNSRALAGVLLFQRDTTGEKDFEEFYTGQEDIDWDRFETVGVIRNPVSYDERMLNHFVQEIGRIRSQEVWDKSEIVALFNEMIPEFKHLETGKYLDSKM
jgi:UDP-N-acetylglucosamine 4,6-dehydratase